MTENLQSNLNHRFNSVTFRSRFVLFISGIWVYKSLLSLFWGVFGLLVVGKEGRLRNTTDELVNSIKDPA